MESLPVVPAKSSLPSVPAMLPAGGGVGVGVGARPARHDVVTPSGDEQVIARVAKEVRMPAAAVERVVAVAATEGRGVLRLSRDQQVVPAQSGERAALSCAEDSVVQLVAGS